MIDAVGRASQPAIALFYLRKNSLIDCRPLLRVSRDEGQTSSEPRPCIPDGEVGYYVLNNDRAVQLKSGRLVCSLPRPVTSTAASRLSRGRR